MNQQTHHLRTESLEARAKHQRTGHKQHHPREGQAPTGSPSNRERLGWRGLSRAKARQRGASFQAG